MSQDYYENSFDLRRFQGTIGVCSWYFDNCYSRQGDYVFATWVFKIHFRLHVLKMELLIPHTS